MDSTPSGYLAWTSGSEHNSLASFWQANCAVRYRSNSWTIRPLRIYGWGECRSRDGHLQKGSFTKFVTSCTQISLDSFLFERMKHLSLCTSHPNLRAKTSSLSVGFFGLQTLQFAAQGDDLVGFALIVFLWTVLATSATFSCSFKRIRAWMGSAGRIWPLNDWNLFNRAHKMTLLDQEQQS